jgi:pimeloyl-ACP methyl ester carboxylesterase
MFAANILRLTAASSLLIALLTGPAAAAVLCTTPINVQSLLEPIPDGGDPNRTPLILIHGWNYEKSPGDPPCTWDKFIDYYNHSAALNTVYKLYRFSYKSNSVNIPQLGLALQSAIDAQLGNSNIAIIAHSMGGLVARYFMSQQFNGQGEGQRVRGLITLGTPHHGSPVANEPVRNAKARAWTGYLNLFDLGISPLYDQVNRRDMWWDNYDGLWKNVKCGLSTCPDNQNSDLDDLNRPSTYDGKIIAYAGNISPNDEPILSAYGNGATILGGIFNLANDGIVPVASAQFAGHLAFTSTRYFSGYNHFEMAALRDRTLCELGIADLDAELAVRTFAVERLKLALAGDFNEWITTATPCGRNDDGVWSVQIDLLPPGRYRYKLVVNGERWIEDPANAMKEPDEYGGFNSILHIS